MAFLAIPRHNTEQSAIALSSRVHFQRRSKHQGCSSWSNVLLLSIAQVQSSVRETVASPCPSFAVHYATVMAPCPQRWPVHAKAQSNMGTLACQQTCGGRKHGNAWPRRDQSNQQQSRCTSTHAWRRTILTSLGARKLIYRSVSARFQLHTAACACLGPAVLPWQAPVASKVSQLYVLPQTAAA